MLRMEIGLSTDFCCYLQACKSHHVPLEGILSMFSNTEDPVFSQSQMDTFSECIEPYRSSVQFFYALSYFNTLEQWQHLFFMHFRLWNYRMLIAWWLFWNLYVGIYCYLNSFCHSHYMHALSKKRLIPVVYL